MIKLLIIIIVKNQLKSQKNYLNLKNYQNKNLFKNNIMNKFNFIFPNIKIIFKYLQLVFIKILIFDILI